MRTLIAFALPLSLVFGASLPTDFPEQVKMSRDRLNRINVVMREHIDAGHLAGASGLLARNGKVVFKQTWGDYKPDTIVRMYSMTKAVTGVAAMILYEEGRFSLSDPLSKYLPEFSNMRVGREATDAAGKRIVYTVPVDRNLHHAGGKHEMSVCTTGDYANLADVPSVRKDKVTVVNVGVAEFLGEFFTHMNKFADEFFVRSEVIAANNGHPLGDIHFGFHPRTERADSNCTGVW